MKPAPWCWALALCVAWSAVAPAVAGVAQNAPEAASQAASGTDPMPPPATPASVGRPAEVQLEPPQAAYWMVTAAALEAWSTDPARGLAAMAPCEGSEVEATDMDKCEKAAKADLALAEAVLAPLMGRRFPTASMLDAAVLSQRRSLCRGELREADRKPPWNCTGADGAPKAAGLPGRLDVELTSIARQAEDPSQARAPQWTGDGCGCGPAVNDSIAYGLFPFWSVDPKGASTAVDFSAFTRIGVQGAFLQTDGSLVYSRGWNDPGRDAWRVAQRYGTRLDLVLYRQSWSAMLARDEVALDGVARRAADAAVDALAASRFTGLGDRVLQWLLWPWAPPEHLYDGLTLWLDYTPDAAPGAAPTVRDRRFAHFADALVMALIDRLQHVPRRLALQIVVPGQALSDSASPWGVERLLNYLGRNVQTPDEHEREGTRVLDMALLVLLPEPVNESDWTLREVLYRSDLEADGERRSVEPDLLVRSLLPMTLVPATAPDPGVADGVYKRLADHDWQYGGVTLWPLPQAAPGAGPAPLIPQLHQALRDPKHWWTDQSALTRVVCPWVCPNRMALRLAFEGLLLAAGCALVLWLLSYRVNALGGAYIGGVALVVAVAALVGLALLSCDPLLNEPSESNTLRAGVLLLALAAVLWMAFRRRVAKP